MKILITGPGRGGTNWLTEIVRASSVFEFAKIVEDREFFNKNILPNLYGTKLATENKGFTWKALDKIMELNLDLFVMFSVRHPISNCMSKIVRGRPASQGGDSVVELIAPDATIQGATTAVLDMFSIYVEAKNKYPNRVLVIRMEDLITNLRIEIDTICKFLNINFTHSMLEAHTFIRNNYQKNRYGNQIRKEQSNIHKRWRTAYNGYFADKQEELILVQSETIKMIIEFEYDMVFV